MPPLFRRSRSDEVLLRNAEAHVFEQQSETLLSPESFIQQEQSLLEASRATWGGTHELVAMFRSDSALDAFRPGVIAVLEHDQQTTEDERVQDVLSNFAEDISAAWFMGARHESGRPKSLAQATQIQRDYFGSFLDRSMKSICDKLSFIEKAKLATAFDALSVHIGSADQQGSAILTNFAKHGLTNASQAEKYRAFLKDPQYQDDPLVGELRHLITVDWFSRRPERSVLQAHILDLKQNPTPFVLPFIEKIVTNPENRDQETVRRMASFAIMAQSAEVSEDGLKQVLYDTKDVWSDEDVLNGAFNRFVAEQVYSLESKLAEIAGRPDWKDIRMHRSDQEILEIFGTTALRDTVTTRVRKAHKKRTGRAMNSASPDLPNAGDIERQLVQSAPPAEREVKVLRKDMNGISSPVEHNAVDYFLGKFKSNRQDDTLRSDIQTVINYIANVPRLRTSGFRRLSGQHINVNGSVQPIWRFAPNQAAGVRVSGPNRFIRAAFVLHQGEIVMVDVMDHDDFDDKYGAKSSR